MKNRISLGDFGPTPRSTKLTEKLTPTPNERDMKMRRPHRTPFSPTKSATLSCISSPSSDFCPSQVSRAWSSTSRNRLICCLPVPYVSWHPMQPYVSWHPMQRWCISSSLKTRSNISPRPRAMVSFDRIPHRETKASIEGIRIVRAAGCKVSAIFIGTSSYLCVQCRLCLCSWPMHTWSGL